MKLFSGISGSTGYCAGAAVVKADCTFRLRKTPVTDTGAEIARFRAAQECFAKKLERISIEAGEAVGPEAAEIFQAYRVIVLDDAFFKTVFNLVERERINIEYAVHIECKNITALFEAMENSYIKERAADIDNVCNELINIMMGIDTDFSHKMRGEADVILIADDLTPVETVDFDKNRLRGIVTERGGATSHTVIIAKALGIPAVIGAKGVTAGIRDGDFVQVDAFSGKITVNPDSKSREAFEGLGRGQH